jgi:hypothetical protein
MRKLGIIAVLSLLVVALAAAAAFAVDDTTSFKGGALTGGRGQQMPRRGQGPRGHPHHAHGQPDHGRHPQPCAEEHGVRAVRNPAAQRPLRRLLVPGRLTTDNQGNGKVRARGIFSEELFVFAPGSVKAPQVDNQDAEKNPKYDPVHAYHLGLWFGDPKDAKEAGCSGGRPAQRR